MNIIKWFALSVFLALTQNAFAFRLVLDGGTFFGPGDAVYNDTGVTGINKFVDAEVRNIVLTGPLIGFIPFFNNGAEEPNVIAEKLQVNGIVDGLVSDGTLINENVDTGLRLNFNDPATGESADVMVVAVASEDSSGGSELILPDEKGNLTFNPSVVADPGDASLVAPFRVVFTTGAARVPLSLTSQEGLAGGIDNAGPLPSGHILIGRMGDFDQDGFLDGHLVLAGNAPKELIVGRGNPVAQIRPWSSDIPIPPLQAAALTLNGVVQNYPEPIIETLQYGMLGTTIQYLKDVDVNLVSVLSSIRLKILSNEMDTSVIKEIKDLRSRLRQVRYSFLRILYQLENRESKDKGYFRYYGLNKKINQSFEVLLKSLQDINDLG